MRSPAPLSIAVEPLVEARLIRVAGEIDLSTVNAVRSELDTAREDVATALLDLSEVTFIDSSGLHLLLEASRNSAVAGWRFFMVRPSAAVRRLIEVSGTADVLTVVEPSAETVFGSSPTGGNGRVLA